MASRPNILFVLEMGGTVNALKPSFAVLRRLGSNLGFVATDVAFVSLRGLGEFPIGLEEDASELFKGFKPHTVVVGGSAFERESQKWTGIELRYALESMERGIPVVFYRDDSGFPLWLREVSDHALAPKLLSIFMFDNATAEKARAVGLRAASIRRIGSAYYDDLLTRDLSADRRAAREAVGISNDAFVVLFNCGADRGRVLEALEPVVRGLQGAAIPHVVFLATFHPKDSDAPFMKDAPSGKWIARASAPYDPVMEQLSGGRITVIREPVFRNAVSDPKMRIIASDLVVMGPGSTEKWTALFAGVPQVIVALPLSAAEAAKKEVEIDRFDFVADGTTDVVRTPPELQDYIARLGDSVKDRFL